MAKIKITNLSEGFYGTECFIDDQKLEKVKGIDFHVAVNAVPTFALEMIGLPEIDMHADVLFEFTPHTVREAIIVLQKELLKHDLIYEAFTASIVSAITDSKKELEMQEFSDGFKLADKIMRRVTGEE